jgi:hypothetical protein
MPAAAAWRVKTVRRQGTPTGSRTAGTIDRNDRDVKREYDNGRDITPLLCIRCTHPDAAAPLAAEPMLTGAGQFRHGIWSETPTHEHRPHGPAARTMRRVSVRKVHMTPVPIDEAAGAVSYRIVPGRDEGWDVVLEYQQHVVSSTHCTDWHRVERVCATLNRQAALSALAPLPTHA